MIKLLPILREINLIPSYSDDDLVALIRRISKETDMRDDFLEILMQNGYGSYMSIQTWVSKMTPETKKKVTAQLKTLNNLKEIRLNGNTTD